MKNTIVVPLTTEEGSFLPIEVRHGANVHSTNGFLDPGADTCYIKKDIAEKLGLSVVDFEDITTWKENASGEVYESCEIGNGKLQMRLVFCKIPDHLPHEVILGRTFTSYFRIIFDGPEDQSRLDSTMSRKFAPLTQLAIILLIRHPVSLESGT